MKFKIISASDVIILREARRILKKLKKLENKLNAAELEAALDDKTLDYQTAAMKNWRMLDEFDALHISVEENGDISLEAQ